MQTKIKGKRVDLDTWGVIALLGVIGSTALEGTGLNYSDMSAWSVVFGVVYNVISNPYKLVTVCLAVLAYLRPRPHYIEEDKYELHN